MKLDKFTDYALRMLVTLAVRAPQRVPTSEIAMLFDMSDNHLSKIATRLVREGFVISERGRNGGLTLALSPDDITIGGVVRAMKRDDHVVECFGHNSTCIIMPSCGLRGPLALAQEAFFTTLDSYTLTQVTQSRRALAELLEIS